MRSTSARYLRVVFAAVPDGSGEDQVDLGVMPNHEIVELFNPYSSSTYTIPVTIEGRGGKPDLTLLSFYGNHIIETTMRAPIVETDGDSRLTNPERLEADWAWIPWWESLEVDRFAWDNLQLYGLAGDYIVGKVDFTSSGWTAHGYWPSSSSLPSYLPASVNLSTSMVPEGGILSFLYVVITYGTEWQLELSAKHRTVNGVNFTIMNYMVQGLAESTKLVVKFTDGWDQVENSPQIIFEAPSVQDIEFRDENNQVTDPPSTVTVTKNVFVPGGAGPAPKDDGGLGTGVIIAIVAGGVAVVIIGVVCVWYFAIRQEKKPVGAEATPPKPSPHNPATGSPQNPQQSPGQTPGQYGQQYPPQYAQPNAQQYPPQYPQQYPPQYAQPNSQQYAPQYAQQYPQGYPQQYPPP
jgi:hypothetical protein